MDFEWHCPCRNRGLIFDVYANPEWTFLARKAEVSRPFSNSARLSLPEYDASSILYCVIFYMLIC